MSDELTFVFLDLAGFTALTEAMGDEEAAGLAGRLVNLARGTLDEGDRIVKSIGDAVLLAAPNPRAGLMLTDRLLDAIETEPNFLVPRTGIHHGTAVERDGDFFGSAVNLVARIAAQAHGGQVLGTEPIAAAAREQEIGVVDLGGFELKNVSEDVRLYEVHVGPRTGGSVIDPVCRMRIERDDSAGRLRHQGADYWFCSLECAAKFLRGAGVTTT